MKSNTVIVTFVTAIVLLSAMPTALGDSGVNLTVIQIDPKYVFEGLGNVIVGNVSNTGGTDGSTGNVSLEVTNAAGLVYYEKNTDNLPIAADGTVEVMFHWTPAVVENVTLEVTADCDNDIVETNENDNSLADHRNTTGDCLVDTMLPAECYGYRGQHPLQEVYNNSNNQHLNQHLIYTTGNYKYKSGWYGVKNYTVSFNIGASGDANRITDVVADIPDGATITMARLYLHYCWYSFGVYGAYPSDYWDMTFVNGACDPTAEPIPEAANYTDCKGFTSRYTNKMYGTIAYDVTDNVTGDGSYCAHLTNNEPGSPLAPKGASFTGMGLLIAYEHDGNPPIEYYIDEGCDRIATSYHSKSEKCWHYYVQSEDATTSAAFQCVDNPPIVKATLFTVVADANSDQETLGFNDILLGTGIWSGSYYYPIGTDSRDVTDELQINPSCEQEIVEFQEGYPVRKNGFSALNAILIVEKGVSADVVIEPETLNLKSNGDWITAYIELPDGYNVSDIELDTVSLDCEIPAENGTQYGFVTDNSSYLVDHDGDGILERLVKFNRSEVIAYLETIDYDGETGVGGMVELLVAGEVAGVPFRGCDMVRVIGG